MDVQRAMNSPQASTSNPRKSFSNTTPTRRKPNFYAKQNHINKITPPKFGYNNGLKKGGNSSVPSKPSNPGPSSSSQKRKRVASHEHEPAPKKHAYPSPPEQSSPPVGNNFCRVLEHSTLRVKTSDVPLSSSPASSPLPVPTPVCISFPTPESPAPRPLPSQPNSHNFSASLSTRIPLSIYGEVVQIDISTLEESPAAIIALLKASLSERDKWMIIAAQYRRKGNSNAAITVINTMIKVMEERGVPESELKAAFLMLSGCETDLARRVPADSLDALKHSSTASGWLRKVYGPINPPNALGLNVPTPTAEVPQKSPAKASKASIQPSPPGIAILQREIQSLRDRNAHVNTLLNSSRAANRKLDDEVLAEREKRRKIERRLEDAESHADSARRKEGYALSQAKREAEARFAAEERAEAEKARREEIEKHQRSTRGQGVLEELANILQQAAKGGLHSAGPSTA